MQQCLDCGGAMLYRISTECAPYRNMLREIGLNMTVKQMHICRNGLLSIHNAHYINYSATNIGKSELLFDSEEDFTMFALRWCN